MLKVFHAMLESVFKGIRGKPADGGMRAHGIIKRLNIAENSRFSGCTGGKMREMETFAFETGEEILRDCVVVRVALARHALLYLVAFEGFAVGAGGVLYAAVGMEYQARIRPLTPHRHVQGVEGKLGVNALTHCVADNLPGA